MSVLVWTRCSQLLILLLALLRMVEVGAKANSIKAAAMGDPPAAPSHPGGLKKGNNPLQVHPCSTDKECSAESYCHTPQKDPPRCVSCRKKQKRCHRDNMCCQGYHCSNYVCVPFSEGVVPPLIPTLEDHSKRPTKGKNTGKAKTIVKGHEGDPCLRSSDCSTGHCCARHFWTKICKPVLLFGEVCTRHRRKGSHSLELFQRCDCAKGLSCKVWRDATSASKSRLHACQRV